MVELTLLAPVLLIVVGFIVFTGRLALASMEIRHAAAAAARAASVTQTPAAAEAAARAEAAANLGRFTCAGAGVDIAADMQPGGRVTVTVACPVALSDLAVIGLPGTRMIRAEAVEPIDLHRSAGGGP